MMGDEMSLRELTQGAEEKPRVMKMGKRNIKAQACILRRDLGEVKSSLEIESSLIGGLDLLLKHLEIICFHL